MKITHIWWCLSYGGIETMLVNIINEQVREAEVSFVIINNKVEDELLQKISPRANIVRIDRPLGSKSFGFVLKLNRVLDRIHPDIIHLHGSSLFNFLCPRWTPQACCTLHDLPKGELGSRLRWLSILQWAMSKDKGNVRCCHRIRYIFSISQSVADALLKQYGLWSQVIPNGIIAERFRRRIQKSVDGCFRIVQVSRLDHEKKGQDLLIDAVNTLRRKGFGHLQLTLIGDGQSRAFLQEKIKKLSLEDEIRLIGSQPQNYIARHLADYDLFVQPSRHEGFGLTVAEAMAAGVPVLVSSGQGPAEVIGNGRYGWLFSKGSVADLAEKIAYIASHEEETYRKTQLAQAYVHSEYHVKTTALRYLEAYWNMLRESDKY